MSWAPWTSVFYLLIIRGAKTDTNRITQEYVVTSQINTAHEHTDSRDFVSNKRAMTNKRAMMLIHVQLTEHHIQL